MLLHMIITSHHIASHQPSAISHRTRADQGGAWVFVLGGVGRASSWSSRLGRKGSENYPSVSTGNLSLPPLSLLGPWPAWLLVVVVVIQLLRARAPRSDVLVLPELNAIPRTAKDPGGAKPNNPHLARAAKRAGSQRRGDGTNFDLNIFTDGLMRLLTRRRRAGRRG